LSGVSVKVSACTAKAENALVIPVDSIYYEDQKPYVYLFVEGKAVKTFIELASPPANPPRSAPDWTAPPKSSPPGTPIWPTAPPSV
jgi:hypothetical protein